MRLPIRAALFAALVVLPLAGTLAGCERKEGPAEEMGEAVDDAVDDAKD